MTNKRKVVLALALGSVVGLVFAGAAFATHPRPLGAAKIRIVFVPAFLKCSAASPAGNKHGAPLTFDACSDATHPGPDTRTGPPPSSVNGGSPAPGPAHGHAHVTIPSDDLSKARGSAFIEVRCYDPTKLPTDPAYWTTETPPCSTTAGQNMDVFIDSRSSDVRCTASGSAHTNDAWPGNCDDPNSNTTAGSDYLGKLLGNSVIRITDHYNDTLSGFTTPGTVVDTNFPVGAGCVGTPTDLTRGSACNVVTSANGIVPGVVLENKRANVEIPGINVYEPGHNGSFTTGTIVSVPGTPTCPPVCNFDATSDEQLFATQGLFLP